MITCKICGGWAVRVNRAEHKFACSSCGHISKPLAGYHKPKPKPQPKPVTPKPHKISH